MRCTFCATGKGGFARNLLPHEIVDQVLTVQEAFGQVSGVCTRCLDACLCAGPAGEALGAPACCAAARARASAPPPCPPRPAPAPSPQRVSNVVFMGMGEPLLNLPSVLRAHEVLNKDLGIGGWKGTRVTRATSCTAGGLLVAAAFGARRVGAAPPAAAGPPPSMPHLHAWAPSLAAAGARHITISTVGVPNAILRMGRLALQSTLAVSIHAPTQVRCGSVECACLLWGPVTRRRRRICRARARPAPCFAPRRLTLPA